MGPHSRKEVAPTILAIVIFLGVCFRVFICFHFNPVDYLYSDPLRHWQNGMWFPKGGYAGAADPIGYQVYVFLLRKITFDNRILIALTSALLSVLMPWTFYRAGRTLGLRKVPALWAWALIVWAPSLLFIYHYMMMETLLILLVGAAFWATAHHFQKGGSPAFVLAVMVWALAVLTKPSVLPLAGICVLWSCWKRVPSLRTVAISAVLVCVIMVPQAIRSKVELGFIAPLGNPWLTAIQHRSNVKKVTVHFYGHANHSAYFKSGSDNAMDFMSPSAVVKPLAPLSDWQARRAVLPVELVFSADSSRGDGDWKKAYRQFTPDWRGWWHLLGENVVFFFFSPSWPEMESRESIDHLEPATRWIWAPIVLLVLAGNILLFAKRRWELLPVATTCFTLFLALQNVVTFEGRYRKPLEPLLLLNLVWVVATWRKGASDLPEDAIAATPLAGEVESSRRN